MLPSGIGFGAKDDRQDRDKERVTNENTPRPRDFGRFESDESRPRESTAEEQGAKKRRERSPNEVCASLVNESQCLI